ncbi:MAG: hypothetical protein A2528_00850 [Candidatus Staskawiczbacteria bacterium RIFOXYD2_FULL_37_9]|nr:MAG: hypothetical protein A2581_00815 [Candidatus Staskawiczbacteria bacterium RIFOXYD1_FULL_37_110]OGZ94773.1 MAG: hypothetical protein A2528_00850 [Candidatus Staskawiczbacteria bacterium RIFOXYD2_FULL_37_9]
MLKLWYIIKIGNMIEVEKKFLLDKEQEKRLIGGTEFLGEKVFTDVYYDTPDFILTSNDKWLPSRSGKWELKLSLDRTAGRKGDLYDEVEDENKIKEILDISGDIEEKYSKFCICKTTRKKYKKQGFGIDIDYVDYGDFTYGLAEIELMVQDKSEMEEAIGKIIEFAKENGLQTGYVRGKVIEYFKKKPEHFQALIKSGTVRES